MKGIVLGAFLLFASGASSGPAALDRLGVESTGTIRVLADCCAFRGDSLASLVEVYIQTFLDGITFVTTADGTVGAELGYDAFLAGPGGRTDIRRWTMPVRLGAGEDVVRPGLSLYDRLDLAVKPGVYDLELEIRDLNGEHRARVALPIAAPELSAPGAKLSDVQLARSITRSTDGEDLWVKSGYRVLPNPSRKYGEAQPVLHCYSEAYGLRSAGEGGEFCTVLYEVEDVEGRNVYRKGPFLIRRAGESAVLVGDIEVGHLSPGYYRLVVSMEDTAAQACVTGPRSSTVFVRAENVPANPPQGLSAAESTAAEVELRFAASPAEVREFRDLNPIGRALFLERFWARKDPDTSTPENEARTALHARIASAQKTLGEVGRAGVDTDRGRIFITHGTPTDVTRLTGDRTCMDHEIWTYQKEREYEFVFFDETGAGVYRLIHSNYPGEINRPEWAEIVCEQQRF
jgi:GWxTD domain-containing protein